MNINYLEEAIKVLGNQGAVAKICGNKVQQQHVSYWLKKRSGKVPPEFAPNIEKACAGAGRPDITKQLLSPDFPWSSVA